MRFPRFRRTACTRRSSKRGHLNVRYLGGINGAAQKLADMTLPGDVVLTLGAGDIYQLGDQLLAELWR